MARHHRPEYREYRHGHDHTLVIHEYNQGRIEGGHSRISVVPEECLSEEEMELFRLKFQSFINISHKTTLRLTEASRLFREDYPNFTEWELQNLLFQCDLNHDHQLSIEEYLKARAFHKLFIENQSEDEILKSFTILDTNGDGLIFEHEVIGLIESSGEKYVSILKQAIQQAAKMNEQAIIKSKKTKSSSSSNSSSHNGSISLKNFVLALRQVNRQVEKKIAAKQIRLLTLESKLASLYVPLLQGQVNANAQVKSLMVGSNTNFINPQHLERKRKNLHLEVFLLKKELEKEKKELLLREGNALTRICENIIASYENEQHVYECLTNFMNFCGIKDAKKLRHNLENTGKDIHILDDMLLHPPIQVKHTQEYKEMIDFSLYPRETLSEEMIGQFLHPEEMLRQDPMYRRIFVHYAMAGNVTNVETITRSHFLKFVHHCELPSLAKVLGKMKIPLDEIEIFRIFLIASKYVHQRQHFHKRPITDNSPKKKTFKDSTELQVPLTARSCEACINSPTKSHGVEEQTDTISQCTSGLTFVQWIHSLVVLYRVLHGLKGTEQVQSSIYLKFIKEQIVPRAKTISILKLAPDVSQLHIVKLLRENIWAWKQLFSHFCNQSLLTINLNATLSMKQLFHFTRTFGILSSSQSTVLQFTQQHRETQQTFQSQRELSIGIINTPRGKNCMQSISLLVLVRESYAAKLDISFANPDRMDSNDFSFREFLRLIQRLALAMHAHQTQKDSTLSDRIPSTRFEAIKENEEDGSQREKQVVEKPLYNRKGNVFRGGPSKTCRMTSTHMIATLIDRSHRIEDIRKQQQQRDILPMDVRGMEEEDKRHQDYQNSSTSTTKDTLPLSHLNKEKQTRPMTAPVLSRSPTQLLYRQKVLIPDAKWSSSIAISPIRPETPHGKFTPRARPLSTGGSPVIRVVK
jgi:Ca2+-binding EF-hand superfamily protein